MTVELIITIIVAIFGSAGFWNWLTNRGKRQTSESKLLKGIAYSEIIGECERYLARGYISADEYHELNHYLFEPYKEMGGNGTAARMMDAVKSLPPIRPDT